MKKQLIGTLDEILMLLRGCVGNEDKIEEFHTCRQRLRRNLHDREALESLRILCAPRGFLGDSPHYPKPDTGMTLRKVSQRAYELCEQIYQVLKQLHEQQLTDLPKQTKSHPRKLRTQAPYH